MQCNCFTCPLGKESYERRLKIYDSLNEDPDYNEIAYSIWCDKTGFKCGWYGHCDEAFTDDIKPTTKINKKQSTKRSRRYAKNKKIKNIYRYNHNWMCPYYEHDSRLVQSNFAWRNKRYYKKHSNKQVRKYLFGISNGNGYRKIFDYWCEVD